MVGRTAAAAHVEWHAPDVSLHYHRRTRGDCRRRVPPVAESRGAGTATAVSPGNAGALAGAAVGRWIGDARAWWRYQANDERFCIVFANEQRNNRKPATIACMIKH